MEQIVLPEGYELVKEGDKYLIKEKERKQTPPRSWEEFCKRYPITKNEAIVDNCGGITLASFSIGKLRGIEDGKCWCVSKEEAEAFLALMQLRQLRKAWVGEWEPTYNEECYCIYFDREQIGIGESVYANNCLTFPTNEMANDFLNCFKDLCETAKILL